VNANAARELGSERGLKVCEREERATQGEECRVAVFAAVCPELRV